MAAGATTTHVAKIITYGNIPNIVGAEAAAGVNINVAWTQPRTVMVVGANSAAFAEQFGGAATVTISLLQVAAIHEQLSTAFVAGVTLPFGFTDLNSGMVWGSPARIANYPAMTFGSGTVETWTWEFLCTNLVPAAGGVKGIAV